MATFVQGFLAKIVIDTVDTTPITVDYTLARTKTVLDKSVMDSSGVAKSIPGMSSGNLDFNGHISTAELNILEAAYAKDIPIAFELVITEGLTTDGSYNGFFTFANLAVETAADGNWSFAASGPTDGVVNFVPSSI